MQKQEKAIFITAIFKAPGKAHNTVFHNSQYHLLETVPALGLFLALIYNFHAEFEDQPGVRQKRDVQHSSRKEEN